VEVTLDVLTGINEIENSAVMIYPNPVSDYLNIKTNSKIIQVQIMNLMGQVIYNRSVDEMTHSVSLSDLSTERECGCLGYFNDAIP
jgi:hypothetical protein